MMKNTYQNNVAKMCTDNNRKRHIFLSEAFSPVHPIRILTLLYFLYAFLCSVYAAQPFTIVRNWSLTGENKEVFEMADTCSFTVTFPDLVPPTYLFGYDRFSVTISDSINPAGMSASPVLQFSFDAGFLYFNHTLTVSIPFSSPLISDSLRNPGQYRLYRDPFPYTGFHQWYEDDSIIIDSNRSVMHFVYHHPKYLPLQKSRSFAKVKIASTGYPFDFAIFFHPSAGTVYLFDKPPIAEAGIYCHATEKGIMICSKNINDNLINFPYRIVAFDISGRKIGQMNLTSFPALLPLSHYTSSGMYLALLYQERRLIAKFSGILKGNGVAP